MQGLREQSRVYAGSRASGGLGTSGQKRASGDHGGNAIAWAHIRKTIEIQVQDQRRLRPNWAVATPVNLLPGERRFKHQRSGETRPCMKQ